MFKFLKYFLVLSIISCFTSVTNAEVFTWYDGHWAHEASDIKPNPKVTFGKLKNGFRYAIIPNSKPKNRVSLYLAIQAGSWMEEPHELGIAHFLEHMAFNGSKRFPADSLIPFFQRHGMNFGGDTNAYTTVDETVYQLNLAKTDKKSLSDGLRVLRDVADGLLLSEKEIQEERGIILSEKIARESEASLAAKKYRKFLYGNSRLSNSTIGLEKTIKNTNSSVMRDFYQRWYVPSRMILVVSGDITAKNVESLIQGEFQSIIDRPAPELNTLGEINTQGTEFFIQKRPVSMTSVNIIIMHQPKHSADTIDTHRRSYCDAIIQMAINRRLLKRTETNPNDWSQAYFQDNSNNNFGPLVILEAVTDAKGWKRTLLALQQELLRIKQYGLTDDEVNNIKNDVEKMLERRVKQVSSWTNTDYAQELISSENNDLVFTSTEEELQLYRSMKNKITTAELNHILKIALAPENRRISVRGNAKVTKQELSSYWQSIQNIKVEAPKISQITNFPYLALPPKADYLPKLKITPLPIKDIEIKQVTFSLNNDTNVVLLPMTLDKGTVNATLMFGDGIQGVPDDKISTAHLAIETLHQSGPGNLTRSDAIRIFSPRGLNIKESIEQTYNYISGQAQSDDIKLLLQTIWTQYQDPTISEKAYSLVIKQMRENDYTINHSVDGIMHLKSSPFFNGPDPRNKKLTLKDAERVNLKEMQDYLNLVHKRGKRTLIIAGDFNTKQAIEETMRLFGSLNKPEINNPNYADKRQFPSNVTKKIIVKDEKVAKSYYLNAWHNDMQDIDNRRLLMIRRLVADVVRERMRLKLREELAVTYSPRAYYRMDSINNGYGYLMMYSTSEPKHMHILTKMTDNIVTNIINNGVTEEELERLKKPMLTAWKSNRNTNALWYNLLMGQLLLNKPTITWYEEIPDLLPTISASEVSLEAKKMLQAPRGTLTIESAIH